MSGWDDVEELLVGFAGDDLADTGEVGPALLACRGEDLVFLAFLRPFEKGCYADPMIELLALAMPLSADRIAVSMAGRAWSLDDPIPPVADGVDLRQRAVVIQAVDGSGQQLRAWGSLHPFDLEGRRVTWHDTLRHDELPEGWIGQALRASVTCREELVASSADIRQQAQRCIRLGHDLYLGEEVARRLRLGGGRCSGLPRRLTMTPRGRRG